MNKQSEEGFTLIELLVVILIVGVLASIAIVAFLNQRKAAHDASLVSDIKNLAVAVQTLPADSIRLSKGAAGVSTQKTTQRLTYFSQDTLKQINVPISDGTWWTIAGDSSKYCIVGYHGQGDKYTRSTPLVYDSTAGGLGRSGDACEPADILGEDGQIVATGNLIDDPLLEKLNVTNQAGWFGRIQSYHSGPMTTLDIPNPVGTKTLETNSNNPNLSQGVIFFQSDTSKAIPVEKSGEKWTASAYVKANAGQRINIGLRPVDVNGNYAREFGTSTVATGDWQRISFTGTLATTDIGSYVGMQITAPPSANSVKIQYAGPMVERSPSVNPFRTD